MIVLSYVSDIFNKAKQHVSSIKSKMIKYQKINESKISDLDVKDLDEEANKIIKLKEK